MKDLTNPLKHSSGSLYATTTARDLNILFEENDLNDSNQQHPQHRQLPQQQNGYAAASHSINFMRPKPAYSTSFSENQNNHQNDRNITSFLLNEGSNSKINMASSSSPIRRPRAGTMPSFINPDMSISSSTAHNGHQQPLPATVSHPHQAAFLLQTINTASSNIPGVPSISGRNRSGSLNLPPPPPRSLPVNDFWLKHHDPPLSPSSEQLLQNDNDFSIARTMRSLGLEDEDPIVNQQQQHPEGSAAPPTAPAPPPAVLEQQQQPVINGLFHHQSPPEFHLPSRSLLSGNNRNRSYSVNAAARYDEENSDGNNMKSNPTNSSCNQYHQLHAVLSHENLSSSFQAPAGFLPNSLDGFSARHRQQLSTRPRASSMSRADAVRMNMLPSLSSLGNFWNNNNGNGAGIRRSPLVSMTEEEYSEYGQHSGHHVDEMEAPPMLTPTENSAPLSLGDSELIANILAVSHPKDDDEAIMYDHLQSNEREPLKQQQQQQKPFTKSILQPSHSTPTTNTQLQNSGSRSLWIGNIDHTVTVDLLTQVFSRFGPIESVRLLIEKECAFVNYFQAEDAAKAKEEILSRMGGRVGQCIVRIGFGKADLAAAMMNAPNNHHNSNINTIPHVQASNSLSQIQPTRALWLGNIPGNMTVPVLEAIFQPFGAIESVRVLNQKNCGFINFVSAESAIQAREVLLNNKVTIPGVHSSSSIRVGFAKLPPSPSPANGLRKGKSSLDDTTDVDSYNGHSPEMRRDHGATLTSTKTWQSELVDIMCQMTMEKEMARNLVKGKTDTLSKRIFIEKKEKATVGLSLLLTYILCAFYFFTDLKVMSTEYYDYIPPLPEQSRQKSDSIRLRDLRKRIDSATDVVLEAEAVAAECMDDMANICADYIGNTVVQRLFEKCSEETKTAMLQQVGMHLATLSVHKNGTWATQKMIDLAKTPEQMELVCQYIKPFIPPLLLDQFGNYAVQCCLRSMTTPCHESEEKEERVMTQFIFDAMVEKLMTIAQGRFGARSMRGILESEYVNVNQKILIAAALCQHSVLLSTNANGALLLSWLIESSSIKNRLDILASQLIPHLPQLCTHKYGSQVIQKLLHQTTTEPHVRYSVFTGLQKPGVLSYILNDQKGIAFIQKVLLNHDRSLLANEQKHWLDDLKEKTCDILKESISNNNEDNTGHFKKLLSQLLDEHDEEDTGH
ncbi:hypothetical protein BDF20DRAFT_670992 [Mycotypha africana]|uniref:uncharacterized protein n=1 Tax=Mycotypha africana TaxID=64632 RepID=UPI002301F9AA|nr:uncharacterized protein BDF20DRAFT_670992 [Mycotypha africana]KAI8973748.1 hypothetical protein BDF20DRAFT_670992 [Mycotypha africana]